MFMLIPWLPNRSPTLGNLVKLGKVKGILSVDGDSDRKLQGEKVFRTKNLIQQTNFHQIGEANATCE